MANPVPVVNPVQPAQVDPTLFQQLQMLTRTGGPEIRALREAQQQQEMLAAAQAAQRPQQQPVGGIPGQGLPGSPGFFPGIGEKVGNYVQYLQDQFKQLNTDNNMGHRIDPRVEDAIQGITRPPIEPQAAFDPRALRPQVRAADLSRFG